MRLRSVIGLVSMCIILATGSAVARTSVPGPVPPAPVHRPIWSGESGKASYYGFGFDGHRSANGARFDQMALTAAHPWLPFGTRVKVTLAGTDRAVVVTITDRLGTAGRVVDLSVAAARQLGIIHRGIATVTLLPA